MAHSSIFSCDTKLASVLLTMEIYVFCTYQRLIGISAQMRQQHDAVIAQQPRMDLGLVLENIKSSARNDPVIQRMHQRRLVDDRSTRRVHHHGRRLHQRKLSRREHVPCLRVQRQIQAEHVAAPQQILERHILSAVGMCVVEAPSIVIDDFHPKRGAGFARHVAPDAAHAEDAQDFGFRVATQRWRGRASELAAAEVGHGRVELAQRPEHQEQARVGGGVVDGNGDVGDLQRRITP